LLFYGAMHASEGANPEAIVQLIETIPMNSATHVSRASRARFEAEREKSTSVVIVFSLFLVLIAGALLVGGHAAIDPLLQSAIAARESKGMGDVIYAMPDGTFCRHMSFDNVTGEAVEGAVERCSDDISRERARSIKSFAWSVK
jgi:hypothetical protein